jgi:hypothetical protein
MSGPLRLSEKLADSDLLRRVVEAVVKAPSVPLKMKEVASAAGISANSAGKYVDLAERDGYLRTVYYGPIRQVWATEEGKGFVSGSAVEPKGREGSK